MSSFDRKFPFSVSLAVFAAIVLVFAGAMASHLVDWLSMADAILISIAVAVPVLIFAITRAVQSKSSTASPKPFLPSKADLKLAVWQTIAFTTFFASFVGPAALVISFASLFPAGDNWPLVLLRVASVLLLIVVGRWYFGWLPVVFERIFRGRLDENFLKSFYWKEPPEPVGVKAAIRAHWEFALAAVLAFAVALRFIDFANPVFKINGTLRRLRGIITVVTWCQGHPNTVIVSAWLTGIGASAYFLSRISRAWRRRQRRESISETQ